jgi:trehalose synthase
MGPEVDLHKIHARQFVFSTLNPWRMERILPADAWERFHAALTLAPQLLDRRVLWHVNSTAAGGGVAEMLGSLLPYLRGSGVDVRWMVMLADAPFFEVTKRLHNFLHGSAGDGGKLGAPERKIYESACRLTAAEYSSLVDSEDVVVLHDPQTAGLIPAVKRRGARVIWRCHIGTDQPNDLVAEAWAFLEPYLSEADAWVFTREAFVPDFLLGKGDRVRIIAPSIDPFSPKNQDFELENAHAILDHAGLIRANGKVAVQRCFQRQDGSIARVDRWCDVLRAGPPPDPDVPLVVQVSRWDRLKDPVGVMEGFARSTVHRSDAHLVLAGPSVAYVADDPEGAEVLRETERAWRRMPPEIRARIALVCIPMRDLEENAAIVNALQRHAAVVVQKSLREGFGLTVTEAMWKGPPVVASAVGGIRDQIDHGENGLLLDDPSDLEAFGELLLQILDDSERARALGKGARTRVLDRFLWDRHCRQYLELIEELI